MTEATRTEALALRKGSRPLPVLSHPHSRVEAAKRSPQHLTNP